MPMIIDPSGQQPPTFIPDGVHVPVGWFSLPNPSAYTPTSTTPPTTRSTSTSYAGTYPRTRSGSAGVVTHPAYVKTTRDWKAIRRTIKWVFMSGILLVVVLLAMSVGPELLHNIGDHVFNAQPVISGSVYTFSADQVTKYRWLHRATRPMHLNGRTVVVNGDVSDAYIHVNGNVTFLGKLTNVHVVDTDWNISANDAVNSDLTARHIAVKGDETGTVEHVTVSPVLPLSKGNRKH